MKKDSLKEMKALLLALSLSISATGCQKKPEPVGFIIENTNLPAHIHNDGLYIYLMNKHELDMESIRPCTNTKDITFLRLIEQTKVNTPEKRKQYERFLKSNMFVYNQDNYKAIEPYLNTKYFNTTINVERLKEYNGYIFTLIKCDAICKKSFSPTEEEIINKGELITSTTLYCENTEIAYSISSSPSLNKYINNISRGNIETGLIKVEDNILEDIQYVGNKEMKELINYVNEENHDVKTLKRDLRGILMN